MSAPKRYLPARPQFDGYAGAVEGVEDFAKCSPARRSAILASLSDIMTMFQADVAKAEQRLAHAAGAVERERVKIAEDSTFLRSMMATYIEYSQVTACEAARAIDAAEEMLAAPGVNPSESQ